MSQTFNGQILPPFVSNSKSIAGTCLFFGNRSFPGPDCKKKHPTIPWQVHWQWYCLIGGITYTNMDICEFSG